MSRPPFLIPILVLLAIPGILVGQRRSEGIVFRSGNIEVRKNMQWLDEENKPTKLIYHQILRDQIDFGECFEDTRYRRLPITYYHPLGPVGLAFQKFNWFPGAVNTYHADARMGAFFTALGSPSGLTTMPLNQLGALWSEPPVAVIGMNVGTPAAYARPLQHFHFFEPSQELIALIEGKGKERFFHYFPDARERGVEIQIFHGPPRQQLRDQGPRRFYKLMILEACSGENSEKIFLEFFRKEGIAQCMEALADDGVLCVHTSHRFVDLPPVLAAIGKDLKLEVRRGHDNAPGNDRFRGEKVALGEIGHFTSEWVLLARNAKVLEAICKTPPNYDELMQKLPFGRGEKYWTTPNLHDHVWTDKGPNLLHGILRGHPIAMRYSAVTIPFAEFLNDLLPAIPLGSRDSHRVIMDLAWDLPIAVSNCYLEIQLKYHPQVEKLWP